MPESFITPLDDRCFALESFVEHTSQIHHHDARPDSSVILRNMSYGRSQVAIADSDRLNAVIFTPKLTTIANTRGKRARSTDDSDVAASPAHHTTKQQQVASPRKGSSRHYGVRFRPDLRKWVAEIRVAEWKDVDKKVWLGTFDTEVGAAHGVDVARKLLRCGKKRPANLPCSELDRYCTTIPAQLDLTDLANDAMFKDVVSFIKYECQAYAAQFARTTTPVAQIFTPYPEEDVFWKNYDNLELSLPESEHPSRSTNVSDFGMTEILDAAFGPFGEFDGYSSTPGSSSEPSSFTGQEFRYPSDSFARGALLDQQQQQQPAAAAAVARAWEMAVDLGVDSLGVDLGVDSLGVGFGVESSLEVEPVCHDLAAAYSLPQTWPDSGAFQLPLNSGLGAEHSPLYMPGDAGEMTFFDHSLTLQSDQYHYQFQMDIN